MPQSAKGWAGIALLLAIMLLPQIAHAQPKLGQETLEYCMQRAKLAIGFVHAVQEGYPLENVNVAWATAPADPEEEAARDEWVATLRAEVKSLMVTVKHDAEFANRVGQAVAEKCAYDFGKGRVGTKIMHKVASSEKIKPEYRHEMCRQALGAHWGVAHYAFNGMSREELHARIERRTDIQDKERARIHSLVDELYDTGLNPQEWLDGHVKACVYGSDA
jgi:hypothetical protein